MDSARIQFTTGRGFFGRNQQQPAPQPGGRTAFRYRIEVSEDGKTYTTILDKTNNSRTKYTEFDELPPTKCRFVRLVMTDWPRRSTPLGILDFTVFGKAVERPAAK